MECVFVTVWVERLPHSNWADRLLWWIWNGTLRWLLSLAHIFDQSLQVVHSRAFLVPLSHLQLGTTKVPFGVTLQLSLKKDLLDWCLMTGLKFFKNILSWLLSTPRKIFWIFLILILILCFDQKDESEKFSNTNMFGEVSQRSLNLKPH